MLMRARDFLLGSLSVLVARGTAACGSSSSGTNSGSTSQGTNGTGGSTSSTGSGNGGEGAGFISHGQITQLAIAPPSTTIDVVNGASSPAHFDAIATYEDGFSGPV